MAKDIAPRPTASALREPTQVEEEAEVDARIEQLEVCLLNSLIFPQVHLLPTVSTSCCSRTEEAQGSFRQD